MSMTRARTLDLLAISTFLAAFLTTPAFAGSEFSLVNHVPGDVFLYAGTRHNSERDFLDQYWSEVFAELQRCGIAGDILDLVGSALGPEQKAEMDRFKGLAQKLAAGVDWSALGGEFAFVERFQPFQPDPDGNINFGPPDLALIFRNDTPKVAENYEGLVAIFKALAAEIDRLSGSQFNLVVDQTTHQNADVARLMVAAGSPNPVISFTMTPAAAEKLAEFTGNNIGKQVLLILDGTPIISPITIRDAIGQQAKVDGHFDARDVDRWTSELKAAVEAGRQAGSDYTPRLQCRLVLAADDPQPADEVQCDDQTLRLAKEAFLDERGMESVDISIAPRVPLPVTLAVAHRDDVIAFFFGEKLLDDVLSLLDGAQEPVSLANTERFKNAVAQLPAPEDALVYCDLRECLKPFRPLSNAILDLVAEGVDVYKNTGGSETANALNRQALDAYRKGDLKEALRLIVQAYETDQTDSKILYNLACFNALEGRKEAAINWLEKAVEAGFYAPVKIQSDPDLAALRPDSRFQEILARAMELAAAEDAQDVILNSSHEGSLGELHTQVLEAYDQKDYQRCLELTQEAVKIAPKDSSMLYNMACFNALLGEPDKALEFLEQSIDAGFYCPSKIAEDPDLESLHARDRFGKAVAEARKNAARHSAQEQMQPVILARAVVDRLLDAAETLDYVVSVESTDGFATRSRSIAALVPNARESAIYPLFGGQLPAAGFDKYLPAETVSFSVGGGLKLEALYKFIEDTFLQAGPGGQELWKKGVDFLASLGFDVQRDLLAWLQGDTMMITLQGRGQFVLMVKVSDEQLAREKVSAALDKISSTLTSFASQNPGLAMLSFMREPADHESLPGFEDLRFLTAPQPIVWGVADGYLIFGGSAEAAAMCLDTGHGKHPNIRQNERFMKEGLIPDAAFSSVAFTDQTKLGQEIAEIIGAIAMSGGMASLAIPDPEARNIITRTTTMLGKLVPVAQRIDFIKSTSTVTTFDGLKWHTEMVTHYADPAERQPAPAP